MFEVTVIENYVVRPGEPYAEWDCLMMHFAFEDDEFDHAVSEMIFQEEKAIEAGLLRHYTVIVEYQQFNHVHSYYQRGPMSVFL